MVSVGFLASACSSNQTATTTSTSRSGHPATIRGPGARGTGGGHVSGPSSGCRVVPAAPVGTTDERISSAGQERSYQQVVPVGYDGSTPMPLVLGLHSLTVDYHVVAAMSGFLDEEQRRPFVAVSPSGRLNAAGQPYWNAAPVPDNGDVVFLTDLLDHLEATLCIDTGRVFAVGMSNGAQMSSLLACRLGRRVDGIAAISGVEFDEPCPGPPVPVIAFHGAEDPIVPYAGGGLNSVAIAAQNLYRGSPPAGITTPIGVDESMRRWAEHNGCDAKPSEERVAAEVRKRTWVGCDAPTELYVVDDGGHAWPGRPQPAFEAEFGHGTTDIDATSLLFRFLFDHRG